MSDDPNDAFSIEFDDEGGNVPGVTQLLNPKLMAEKAAAKKAAAASKPPPIIAKTAPKTPDLSQAPELKEIAIGFDDVAGGTMPGISQLLNPKAMAAKAQSQKATAASSPAAASPAAAKAPSAFSSQTRTTITPLLDNEIILNLEDEAFPPSATASHQPPTEDRTRVISSLTPLAVLGVQLELVFEKKQNQFRFARVKGHAKAGFEPWQEKFFAQMKIDLAALGIQISFQEFSKKENLFQAEAFGLTDATFVQVVRLENEGARIFVLLSSASLLLKQDEVRSQLSGKTAKKDDDTGEFKIELAS